MEKSVACSLQMYPLQTHGLLNSQMWRPQIWKANCAYSFKTEKNTLAMSFVSILRTWKIITLRIKIYKRYSFLTSLPTPSLPPFFPSPSFLSFLISSLCSSPLFSLFLWSEELLEWNIIILGPVPTTCTSTTGEWQHINDFLHCSDHIPSKAIKWWKDSFCFLVCGCICHGGEGMEAGSMEVETCSRDSSCISINRKQRKENACVHKASSFPSFFIQFMTSIHEMGPPTFKSGLHSIISCEDVVKVTSKGVPHYYITNTCTGMRLSFFRGQPSSI